MTHLRKWSPFEDMLEMQRDMTRSLGRLFRAPLLAPSVPREAVWSPDIDIFARGEDMVIRAELPGVKIDDVDISVSDNVLTLKGDRRIDKEINEDDYYSSEMSYGAFERNITLPRDVRTEDIKAAYENGILEITIPKAAKEARPRKVKVEVRAA